MISLADMKQLLGIEETDTSYDDMLVALEQRVVAFIERLTDRYFGPEMSREVYLDGHGTRFIWMPELPVDISGDDIIVEYESSPCVWEVVPTSDYCVRDRRLVHTSRWNLGMQNYRITLTLGYLEGMEPGEIRQLALDLIASKFGSVGSEGEVKSESIGGYSYTLSDSDVDSVDGWDVVNLWRRPVFA